MGTQSLGTQSHHLMEATLGKKILVSIALISLLVNSTGRITNVYSYFNSTLYPLPS